MAGGNNKSGGGAKTNANGLSFEEKMDINVFLKRNGYSIDEKNDVYLNKEKIGVVAKKHDFYSKIMGCTEKYVRKHYISRILLPDASFLNYSNETLYIIEIKYQKDSGSVDEKLQTCDFKKEQYTKLSKHIEGASKVKMIYVVNEFFNDKKYKDVFDYMDKKECVHAFAYSKKMLGLK